MIRHTIPDPGVAYDCGRVYASSDCNVWPLAPGRFLVGFNAAFHHHRHTAVPWPTALARDWHYYVADSHHCRPLIVSPQDATALLDGETWARSHRKVCVPYRERATGDLVIRLENWWDREARPKGPADYYRLRDGGVLRDPDPEIPPGGTPTERFKLPFAKGRLFYPATRHPSIGRTGEVAVVSLHGTRPSPLWHTFFPGREVAPEEVAVVRFSGRGDQFGAALTRYAVAEPPYAVAACVAGTDELSVCALLIRPQQFNPDPPAADPQVVILDL